MLASRDMNECYYLSADPPAVRACPCSAVLRRPLISTMPHLWAGGWCRRCRAAHSTSAVPNCWYHPHRDGRDGTCLWCGLPAVGPDRPLDCPGMPRAVPVLTNGAFPALAAD
jgi:hypothetical protein